MGRVVVDISLSMDGYVAGRGVTVQEPFGDAGHRLHRWIGLDEGEPTAADRDHAVRTFVDTGAFVLGRRMFDVGIDTWGEDGAFGTPCFVVTSRRRPDLVRGATTFNLMADDVTEAVALARRAAGDRDVVIPGGASVVQQCLAADVVDALHLHLVPVVLGAGTPLFGAETPRRELELRSSMSTPNATHLVLDVVRERQRLTDESD